MKVLALVAALAIATPAAGAVFEPGSRWLPPSGNVEIEIVPCGEALCGVVVRVLANNSMVAGSASNAPPATVGMKILTGLRPGSEGTWSGKVYNRENGKTYDCRVSFPARDRMEVRGYIGLPALGQSQVWTRRPAAP